MQKKSPFMYACVFFKASKLLKPADLLLVLMNIMSASWEFIGYDIKKKKKRYARLLINIFKEEM